jgi:hypothetical protein
LFYFVATTATGEPTASLISFKINNVSDINRGMFLLLLWTAKKFELTKDIMKIVFIGVNVFTPA